MDSLRTGSMQSWLIVATIALSPIIILVLADTIGRIFDTSLAIIWDNIAHFGT